MESEMKNTKAAPAANPSQLVGPFQPTLALDIFETHCAQLAALARVLEQRLGEACNFGENPPDDSPMTEWRLAEVLLEKLDDASLNASMCRALGLPTTWPPSPSHGPNDDGGKSPGH
jgi:hypothetical protein